MNYSQQYLEEAQQYLEEANLYPAERLLVLRDMAQIRMQADQVEQLELIVNKLYEPTP